MSMKRENTGKEENWVILAPDRTDLYWRGERKGYTMFLAEAGIYSKKEAESIVNSRRGDRMKSLAELLPELRRLHREVLEHNDLLQCKISLANEDVRHEIKGKTLGNSDDN